VLPFSTFLETMENNETNGYITKQGGSRKNWHKRYLVMENDSQKFIYYEKDNKKTKKGEILFSDVVCYHEIGHFKDYKYVIGLKTTVKLKSGTRTYLLETHSETEYQKWITAISAIRKSEPFEGKVAKTTREKHEKEIKTAKKVGSKIVKTLEKLEWSGFKKLHLPDIDDWFDSCGDVVELIVDLAEICDNAKEGVILLCDAKEMIDEGVEEKSVKTVIQFMLKTTKLKGGHFDVTLNDDHTIDIKVVHADDCGVGWVIFDAVAHLIMALNKFIVDMIDLVPKLEDFALQCQDIPGKIETDAPMLLNPLKIPVAITHGAHNVKQMLAIPHVVKDAIHAVKELVKLIHDILKEKHIDGEKYD